MWNFCSSISIKHREEFTMLFTPHGSFQSCHFPLSQWEFSNPNKHRRHWAQDLFRFLIQCIYFSLCKTMFHFSHLGVQVTPWIPTILALLSRLLPRVFLLKSCKINLETTLVKCCGSPTQKHPATNAQEEGRKEVVQCPVPRNELCTRCSSSTVHQTSCSVHHRKPIHLHWLICSYITGYS